MKKYLGAGVAFFLLTAGLSCGWAADKGKTPVKVHIIGDSTMADYEENTTRTRGWGEMLQEFFSPDVEVVNYAKGGRSSHSFYKEGRWKLVTDSLKPGDYVFIQFAHNDEKEGGKDGADGRGTAPWTTYKTYIEKYVDETRASGATPILITPIVRRYFTQDGTISPKGCHDLSIAPDDSTLNYVRVMKHVARNKQVKLVDMTAMTKEYAERLGAERTIKCIYIPTDGTHTQATGAACYARLAVEGLKEQGILADYIHEDLPVVLNPVALDFKTLFVGEEGTVCFDLTGLNLEPVEGELTVEAPDGMTVADDPHGRPQKTLRYPYQNGELWNKCFYLHFTPTGSGNMVSDVIISYGGNRRLLPVKAEVKDVVDRSPVEYVLEKPSALRDLKNEAQGVTTETGKWPAEIDEAQNRYIEFILPPSSQTVLLRKLSFTLDGDVAYRVACAYGKDFYPRTDLGEEQKPQTGRRLIELPMNVTLSPGQQMYFRLFPWSTVESDDIYVRTGDWKIEGTVIR
ncbi:MAG: rhamnogalacturonan acetylesterase [Duncaniella sp.]|uniref:rhamnogalacturonan acetylesterase n=1 Tax=Duncaniella sp. TaxID=2518496 RepID=UPI0023BEB9E5|nr:rhamnogalacturonan acetylesterase [Duncaniella sp.]MDE6089695.1 rhamnogalacturonan acetylesterase [Duncaniella sp.]